MLRENHYYIFRRKLAFLPGETGVYLNTLLRAMGMNLVYVFVPLYVFKLTGRIEAAFLYYAIYHIWVLISVIPSGWLITKIGIDWAEFAGSFIRIFSFIFLILGKSNLYFLALAYMFWGIAVPFTWLPFHYAVVGTEDGDQSFGKETSWIKIFDQLAGSLSPLIGGLIIVGFGFSWLYRLAIFLVILSGLPMFFDKFNKRGMEFKPLRIINSIKAKENRGFVMAFAGAGIKEVVVSIAWPLFMFLMVAKYEVIGGIQTAALLLSLVFLWWLGKKIDQGGSKILRWGVGVNGFVWLVRSVLTSPAALFISNVIYGFGGLLLWTPFDALVYKSMLKRRKLEFLVVREIAIHAGGLFGSILIWQLIKIGVDWFWIFSIAIFGLASSLLVAEEEYEDSKKT